MRRLTTKKVLKITIELWEWLVENPGKNKEEWLGWRKYGRMAGDCSLCDYKIQEKQPCSKCLIYWRKKPDKDNCCIDYPDSPFEKWCNATTIPTRKKYALEIVKLAKEKLAELNREAIPQS